jgi:SAM-dependent methyltransferase
VTRFWKGSVTATATDRGLLPGDTHYRAYVGPPENYDLISAMVFNLLTCVGLRQHHRLLDIGCGSLRSGRLLIPYLDPGKYIGVEPNKRAVIDGIAHELGDDIIQIKKPVFSYKASLEEFDAPLELDYAVAQSIFSHTSKSMLDGWLADVAAHMRDTGALFATFLRGNVDYAGEDWVYPGCVKYRIETMRQLACKHGFSFELLKWYHPLQSWALFSRPHYDKSLIEGGEISWNRHEQNRRVHRPGMKC